MPDQTRCLGSHLFDGRWTSDIASRAADNPLIGTWKWDNNKTLREFRLPTVGSEQFKRDAARAKRFVEGQIRNLQSTMTLTYTDQECTQAIVGSSGTVISRESIP